MRRWMRLGGALAGLALVAACAGGGGAQPKPTAPAAGQSVTLRTLDTFRFEPATFTVRAGTPVSLTLDNSRQALIHDFTIDSLDGQRVHIVVNPGQRTTGQFTANTPGTYQFYCWQPGHREAGMVGTMTVTP
jgi:uncharacterized cupredoxin-like copper-binding protein